jgi:uncharacterized membrane protein
MKNNIMKLWVAGLLAATCLFSCKKEEAPVAESPVITIKEVGTNNSKVAYTGNDLHLDAEVKAPGKIASIKLQITLAETTYGWDFVKTYTTPYAGSKNADFHEHIDVPENARAGTYTLLIIVTDESGEKTQSKVDFQVIKDLSLPRITEASLKATSTAVLNLSGTIQASNKIARLVVEVQSSAWTREFIYTDAAMVDQSTFRLNKDIDVSSAPGGHYHINVTVVDKAGKQALYAFHLDR